jgi:hypothetical protein
MEVLLKHIDSLSTYNSHNELFDIQIDLYYSHILVASSYKCIIVIFPTSYFVKPFALRYRRQLSRVHFHVTTSILFGP